MKRKKYISLILFLVYLGEALLATQTPPEKYVAYKTDENLHIDGKMEEVSWQKASWCKEFVDIEGIDKPTYKTNMKMLWDRKYLYFLAQMEEPHIWGTLKQRDTVIFYNNDFEIFIDPDGDTHNYMELEINALNTVWDLFLTKPYRNHGKVLDSWDIQGIKTAVYVNGTINDPRDEDHSWSVELAIPWEVLKEANTHNNIPEGEFWRISFSRVNWKFDLKDGKYSRKKNANGTYVPEYNWVWSPQGVINMHEPEKWGYVYFSPNEVGVRDSFEIPKDEYIKWYLYELYRDFINENKRVGWTKKLNTKVFTGPIKNFFGSAVTPILEKNNTGFSILARSPFSNRILLIKDDGKFTYRDR